MFRLSERARGCVGGCIDGCVYLFKCLKRARSWRRRSEPGDSKCYSCFWVKRARKGCGKMLYSLCAKICCWKRLSAEAQLKKLKNTEDVLKQQAGLGLVGKEKFIKSALGLSLAKKIYKKEIASMGKVPGRPNAVHPGLSPISSGTKFMSSNQSPRKTFNRSQTLGDLDNTNERLTRSIEGSSSNNIQQFMRLATQKNPELNRMPSGELIKKPILPKKDRRNPAFDTSRPTFGLISKFARADNSIVPTNPSTILPSLASRDLGMRPQSPMDDRHGPRFTQSPEDYVIPEVDEENWSGLNAYERQKCQFFKDDFGAAKK